MLCNVNVSDLHTWIVNFIQIPDNIYHAVLKIAINSFLVVLFHKFHVTFQQLFRFILEFKKFRHFENKNEVDNAWIAKFNVLFSYYPVEIGKINPREILSCRNHEIMYLQIKYE